MAQGTRVVNRTGSFDALVWMVPDDWGSRPLPKGSEITLPWVKAEGGSVDQIVLLDWKTGKGVYTDQVVQAHAYLSAEFVGSDGIVNRRLTDLLLAARRGGLVHIRPNAWAVHLFEYEEEIVRAFFGSVAFAVEDFVGAGSDASSGQFGQIMAWVCILFLAQGLVPIVKFGFRDMPKLVVGIVRMNVRDWILFVVLLAAAGFLFL